MKRQRISGIYADASAFAGQQITVCGWVRTVRDLKNFGFIELNDGSCFKSLQVVFDYRFYHFLLCLDSDSNKHSRHSARTYHFGSGS